MSDGSPRVFAKRVATRALILTLGSALLLYALGQPAWTKGVGLGGLASVASFLLMAWALPKVLLPDGSRSQGWGLLSIALRFGLMAVALVLSLKMPQRFALGGCVAGLFAVQITLLMERFWESRFKVLA